MFQEGVTGTWFPAWVLLHQRTLIYTKSLDPLMAITFGELDLRKARCIGKFLIILLNDRNSSLGSHIFIFYFQRNQYHNTRPNTIYHCQIKSNMFRPWQLRRQTVRRFTAETIFRPTAWPLRRAILLNYRGK